MTNQEQFMPAGSWEDGLWPGIRSGTANALSDYLHVKGIEPRATYAPDSSWILRANLYFPFRRDSALIAAFLTATVDARIATVESLELDYCDTSICDPVKVLGEPLAPDLGFLIRSKEGGRGLIVALCRNGETSFGRCPGYSAESGNPDPEICLNFASVYEDLLGLCWQMNWENRRRPNRRYWEQIHLSELAEESLLQCPAVVAYDLFRYQALTEALARRRRTFDFATLCVAYDARNDALRHSLTPMGVDDFTTGWAPLHEGKAGFQSWTHQSWVAWVREHDTERRWSGWSDYIHERYGY
jgi:hypothetical protein